MTRLILTALCVVAAAAASAAKPASSEIAGRWQGPNYRMAALAPDCGEGKCKLTLDIVRCAEGWCGIEVGDDNSCGATALKMDAGEKGTGSTVFKGRLALAQGTEPYVIQAYLIPASDDDSERLEFEGDTGGEFRAFRRSFPFSAHLVRAGEAHCRSEKPVS
jgi:hypothetical protein